LFVLKVKGGANWPLHNLELRSVSEQYEVVST